LEEIKESTNDYQVAFHTDLSIFEKLQTWKKNEDNSGLASS